MRDTLLACVLGTGLICAVSPQAHAQLTLTIDTADPLTHLPPDQWIQLVTRVVNAKPLIGKASVYMVNATGEELGSVTCGSYQLVGAKPYITNNRTTNAPATLPAWTITLVPSEGFNTYCRTGVDALGTVANYHGSLNASNHTFNDSTFVIFQKPSSQ